MMPFRTFSPKNPLKSILQQDRLPRSADLSQNDLDLPIHQQPCRSTPSDRGLSMAESGEDPPPPGKKMNKEPLPQDRIFRRLFCCGVGKQERKRRETEIHQANGDAGRKIPRHLVIMVSGVLGSAKDWRFAEKQFLKKLGDDVIVHRSTSNCDRYTLDGVDVTGKRLSQEVRSVVQRRPELQRISFVGHSLGGLIARYAIAELYEEDEMSKRIAGLEPVNFVTFATPHVGSRWHKQIPALCGVGLLEKTARRSSWILGRTGRQLFLDDNDDGRPPLLVRMVKDHDDLPFMSAIGSFRRRAVYSNTRFDHIVGWKTSSIRLQHELPKLKGNRGINGYPHIIHVESQKEADSEQNSGDLQESMIRSLNQVHWERVDVSFHRTIQRLLAHTTILVKTRCLNSAGSDVISHLIDNFIL